MKFPTAEILSLVFQLLPGFVVAWIFYSLTAHLKKDQFEQTIQALIFTGIVKAVVIPIQWLALWLGGLGYSLGEWNADGEHVLSFAVAVALGLVFASIAHTNFYYDGRSERCKEFIKKWLTKKTCHPSEWFSVFNRIEAFVRLQLKDGRRVYGWPEEYPDSPESGHLVLMRAAWVNDDETMTPLEKTERLLIPVDQIVIVEFMSDVQDSKPVVIQPASSNASAGGGQETAVSLSGS